VLLEPEKVQRYLERRFSGPVRVLSLAVLGHEPGADPLRLPRHVRSLDIGGFSKDGSLISVGDIEEFFTLHEFVQGEGYNRDRNGCVREGPCEEDASALRAATPCSSRRSQRSGKLCTGVLGAGPPSTDRDRGSDAVSRRPFAANRRMSIVPREPDRTYPTRSRLCDDGRGRHGDRDAHNSQRPRLV